MVTLIGPCVIENEKMVMQIGKKIKNIKDELEGE